MTPNERERNEDLAGNFVFPNIESEQGEIERVAREFAGEDVEAFATRFIERAEKSLLAPITEELWARLENTGSYNIPIGGWDAVEERIIADGVMRNWRALREKMEQGEELDAPIICEKGGRLHLVSGNTRLMVARALGVAPHVLVVSLDLVPG